MLLQVVVGTAVDTLNFLESERHLELDVGSGICIESELLVVVETVVLRSEAQSLVPFHTELLPFLKPFLLCARLNEELHLHLLELPHTEDELAGNDLVAECLTDLCDSERYFHTTGFLYVKVIHEDTLCGFRTEVNLVCCIRSRAHLGREHQVKLAYVGPVLCSTDRVNNLFIDDNLLQSLKIWSLHSLGVTLVEGVALFLVLDDTRIRLAELCLVEAVAEALACLGNLLVNLFLVFCNLVFDKNIGAVAFLRVAVVDERVVESVNVAACLPDSRVHKDGGVDAHDILVEQYHALPPIFLDVVFQFYTILSVVVDCSQSVVNVATWKYESVLLAM